MRKILLLVLVSIISGASLFSQQLTITGKVTSADDQMPLPGVTVVVKGTTVGTITDFDGFYNIQVAKGSILVYSFLGMKPQEVLIDAQTSINISLDTDSEGLEEIVVIGYGTMKKSDLTGAVASVKSEELQRTPASGIDQALQGKVAGVTVNSNSGQPGEAAVVRIRGIGTVHGSAPIYVVDGMIVSDISFLSPNDIKSTEILKDASATAIYGSRGANGVILITTKKGGNGKAKITFNTYTGVQNRWNKLDLMQRDEFAETILKLNPNASTTASYQQDGFNAWMVNNVGDSPYYPLLQTDANPYGMDYSSVETDWQDEVFRENAMVQDYYLSMTGGDDKNNYVISASYFNQDGTIIGSDYERLTLRVNTSSKVNNWLKIGENLSFVNSTGRNAMNNDASPGASVLSAAIAMAPWDPTHYADGSINKNGQDLSGQISAASNFKNVTNPYSMVEHSHPNNKVERWVGDIFLELTPIKNFSWRSALSMDLANNRDKSFYDKYEYSAYDQRDLNYLSSSMQHYRTLIGENIINYKIEAKKHRLSIMAGQTIEQYENYGIGGAGAAILNPVESNWYLSNTTLKQTLSSDNVERRRIFSLLSRVHYVFDNRYLVTANFRADATSKFPENPWGYFPSVALAWRLTQEDWMKDFSAFDQLKLRFGWGQIGNEQVPSNRFVTLISSSSNVFTGYPLGVSQELVNGSTVTTYANRGGKWETTEQINAGIDFGIRNGFLSGSLDGFIRDTKDMILDVQTPAQVGNRFYPMSNVGTVRNQGIELVLNHHKVLGALEYSIGGNVAFIKNELTALNDGSPLPSDRTLNDEGLALFSLWGYEYDGIYYSDEEALTHLWSYAPDEIGAHAGDAKYVDRSGPDGVPDGKIDAFDETVIGNPFPWLTYGLNFNAEYRGFDLQIFLQGVYGNEIYNAVRHRTEGTGNDATLSTDMRDVWVDYSDVIKASMEANGVDWTELINPDGTIPNPNGTSLNKATSDRFVENGAYLRMKTFQIGYTLPKSITNKANIDRCRIYLGCNNLFTITNYTGYDPEIGNGIDYGNYPQARTIMIGVNMDL